MLMLLVMMVLVLHSACVSASTTCNGASITCYIGSSTTCNDGASVSASVIARTSCDGGAVHVVLVVVQLAMMVLV